MATIPYVPPIAKAARWIVGAPKLEAETLLMQELGIPKIVARVLVQRGFDTPAVAYKFLNPSFDDFHSPELLPDYVPAVAAIPSGPGISGVTTGAAVAIGPDGALRRGTTVTTRAAGTTDAAGAA